MHSNGSPELSFDGQGNAEKGFGAQCAEGWRRDPVSAFMNTTAVQKLGKPCVGLIRRPKDNAFIRGIIDTNPASLPFGKHLRRFQRAVGLELIAYHAHPIESDLFSQQCHQRRPGIGRIERCVEHELADIGNCLKETVISGEAGNVTAAPHVSVENPLAENRNKIPGDIASVRGFKNLVGRGFLSGDRLIHG